MARESRMSQTGNNFLTALAISIIAAFAFILLTSFAAVIFKLTGKEKVEATTAIIDVSRKFFDNFFGLSTCVVPIVTIFAFALLQRTRIKDNLTASDKEESEA